MTTTEIPLVEIQRSSRLIQAMELNQCGRIFVDDDTENLVEDQPSFRVIHGNEATKGHHPWQATIRVKGINGKSSHWCGAVLLSKHHILTAAHCLHGYAKGAYLVRLGDHQSNVVEDSEMEVFIEDWYVHEHFRKGQNMNNDIALVLLKFPARFSEYIQPICLPDTDTKYSAGMNCTISGWGSIQHGKSSNLIIDFVFIILYDL